MGRILLLFAVLQTQIYVSLCAEAGSGSNAALLAAAREARQRQIISGSSSSSYTQTTLDHESGSPSTGSGTGAGLNQPQAAQLGTGGYQAQTQTFENGGGAGFAVPPPLASGFDFSTLQMNSVLRPGEYVPNCGCVDRGACSREIGQYTRLVGQYSDVVCGYNFERCCFDGPCPGVLDEFVRAAPCVPQEQCLRPYGVLPTDVRDFGIIAPCPGQGAVRCITVDDSQLLQFQASVAAIEASQERYNYEAAAQVQAQSQSLAEENVLVNAAPVPAPVQIVVQPQPQPQLQPQPEPEPERVVVPIIPAAPAPLPQSHSSISTFTSSSSGPGTPISGQTTTVTTGTPFPVIEDNRELFSNIATFLANNPGAASAVPVNTVTKGEVGHVSTSTVVANPRPRPLRPQPVTPARVPVRVPATETSTTVVAPPTSGFVQTPAVGGGYRFDCRASGCYTPWAYRGGLGNYGLNYPSAYRYGFGFPGLGYSKSFHFSKGYNVFG